jgi:hypothetical protein
VWVRNVHLYRVMCATVRLPNVEDRVARARCIAADVLFDGNEKDREMSATSNGAASGATPGRFEARPSPATLDVSGKLIHDPEANCAPSWRDSIGRRRRSG